MAEVAIRRGLPPFSISTDLHTRSLDGPVWDMATTMSKVMALGLDLPDVIRASTTSPMEVCRMPTANLLAAGTPAELTVFDVADADVQVTDSMRETLRLRRLIEPRFSIIRAEAIPASRHMAPPQALCECCGQALKIPR